VKGHPVKSTIAVEVITVRDTTRDTTRDTMAVTTVGRGETT